MSWTRPTSVRSILLVCVLTIASAACTSSPESDPFEVDDAPQEVLPEIAAQRPVTDEDIRNADPSQLPPGVTIIRFDEILELGDLGWAWAIASDHGDIDELRRVLQKGIDVNTLIGGDYRDPGSPQDGSLHNGADRSDPPQARQDRRIPLGTRGRSQDPRARLRRRSGQRPRRRHRSAQSRRSGQWTSRHEVPGAWSACRFTGLRRLDSAGQSRRDGQSWAHEAASGKRRRFPTPSWSPTRRSPSSSKMARARQRL